MSSCGLGLIPVLWGRLGLQCFPTFLRFSGEGGAVRRSNPRHDPASVNWLVHCSLHLDLECLWAGALWLWQVKEDTGCLQLSLCLQNTWCWSRGQLTLQPWQSSNDRGKESWCSWVLLNITPYRNHWLCTWCWIIFPLSEESRRFFLLYHNLTMRHLLDAAALCFSSKLSPLFLFQFQELLLFFSSHCFKIPRVDRNVWRHRLNPCAPLWSPFSHPMNNV